jgi:hypothetical protein
MMFPFFYVFSYRVALGGGVSEVEFCSGSWVVTIRGVAHVLWFCYLLRSFYQCSGYLRVGWCGLYVPLSSGIGAAGLCVVYMLSVVSIKEEDKSRLSSGNACYYSVQNLLSYRLLSKNLNIRIYTYKYNFARHFLWV